MFLDVVWYFSTPSGIYVYVFESCFLVSLFLCLCLCIFVYLSLPICLPLYILYAYTCINNLKYEYILLIFILTKLI